MGMSERVAKMRLNYHANVVEINNVLNQLHIISDEKAEEIAKKHVMIIVNDVLPRIFGQKAVDELFKK